MIEVLKQMQKALREYHYYTIYAGLPNQSMLNKGYAAYQAGLKAIAQVESQEPVAWIHNFIEGGISIGKRPTDLDRHPDRWTALYKEPAPCPTCEALARTVMLDQTSHDTPPQRTWVDLTRTQIQDVYFEVLKEHRGGHQIQGQIAFGEALQAKIKERNT
jgi:hypothetical protein